MKNERKNKAAERSTIKMNYRDVVFARSVLVYHRVTSTMVKTSSNNYYHHK